MIKSNENGEVIIEIDGIEYNLSVNDQYVELLLKLTSPNRSEILEENFAVCQNVQAEYIEKMVRYSHFLIDFLRIRNEVLDEAEKSGTGEDERLSEIEEFIGYLNTSSSNLNA